MAIILVEPCDFRPLRLPPSSSPRCVTTLAVALPASAQKRVLYLDYVGPNAHNHPSRVNARAAMTAIAQASNGFFTVDLRTDPTGLDAAVALGQYDAVVFFTCGDLSAAAPLRQALFDFVASGKGFVGFHSAADSFYSWPEYRRLPRRPLRQPRQREPARHDPRRGSRTTSRCRASANPFTFTEEFYLFRGPERDVDRRRSRARDLHVLMNLDPATPTPARPVPQPQFPQLQGTDLPLAWTRAARRRPRLLLGVRPPARDLGQPAVPRPRGRGDPLGAVRRRLRRA